MELDEIVEKEKKRALDLGIGKKAEMIAVHLGNRYQDYCTEIFHFDDGKLHIESGVDDKKRQRFVNIGVYEKGLIRSKCLIGVYGQTVDKWSGDMEIIGFKDENKWINYLKELYQKANAKLKEKELALEFKVDEKAKKIVEVLGEDCSPVIHLFFDEEIIYLFKNKDIKIEHYRDDDYNEEISISLRSKKRGFLPVCKEEMVYLHQMHIDKECLEGVRLFKKGKEWINLLNDLYQEALKTEDVSG